MRRASLAQGVRVLLCSVAFAIGVVVSFAIQVKLNDDFVCNDITPEVAAACAAPTPELLPTAAGGLLAAGLAGALTTSPRRSKRSPRTTRSS